MHDIGDYSKYFIIEMNAIAKYYCLKFHKYSLFIIFTIFLLYFYYIFL